MTMNYLALFFAIISALIAIGYAIQFIRVAAGKAHFNSRFAWYVNFVTPAIGGVFAVMFFRMAVGA